MKLEMLFILYDPTFLFNPQIENQMKSNKTALIICGIIIFYNSNLISIWKHPKNNGFCALDIFETMFDFGRVENVFASSYCDDFVFSGGAARVSEHGQLADHRAARKNKIATTKWIKNTYLTHPNNI